MEALNASLTISLRALVNRTLKPYNIEVYVTNLTSFKSNKLSHQHILNLPLEPKLTIYFSCILL